MLIFFRLTWTKRQKARRIENCRKEKNGLLSNVLFGRCLVVALGLAYDMTGVSKPYKTEVDHSL